MTKNVGIEKCVGIDKCVRMTNALLTSQAFHRVGQGGLDRLEAYSD